MSRRLFTCRRTVYLGAGLGTVETQATRQLFGLLYGAARAGLGDGRFWFGAATACSAGAGLGLEECAETHFLSLNLLTTPL